ncbi:aspartyl-phosphate phosphatase Spo0E family protein [Lachnospiraceae bacterium 54-53]
MMMSKEELIRDIEEARERLNKSIEHDDADIIYHRSVELDKLIEKYIAAGY